MFKKLFFTAAAAAAVSVPLAGVAWATPANNDPPGQRDTNSGQPGIPGVVGDVADAFHTNPTTNLTQRSLPARYSATSKPALSRLMAHPSGRTRAKTLPSATQVL